MDKIVYASVDFVNPYLVHVRRHGVGPVKGEVLGARHQIVDEELLDKDMVEGGWCQQAGAQQQEADGPNHKYLS